MAPGTSGSSALNALTNLTKIEEVVMRAAARLFTALEYREENPGGDFRHYLDRIPLELHLVTEMFQLAQTRSESEDSHRLQAAFHPVLTAVGQLWRAAEDEDRPPRLEDISLADIRKTCATMAKKYRDSEYPPIFFETDLSRLAYALPQTDHWWLLPPPKARSQDMSNKGKAHLRAPRDVDTAPRHVPPRGTKRSAAFVAQDEEHTDEGNGGKNKTSLRKVGKAGTRRTVIRASSSPPPQRRRVEEEAESESEESSTEQWVARGKDRCEGCKRLDLPACEPQWQALQGFSSCKACKACARKKIACKPTKVWMEKVAAHNQKWIWRKRPTQVVNNAPETQADGASESAEGPSAAMTTTSRRRRGKPPKATDAAPTAVAISPQLTKMHEIITAIDTHIQLMDVRIEAEISDLKACIEGHSASLATLERTQQELRNMLLMLCGQHAITVASAMPSTSASSSFSPVVGFSNVRGSGSALAYAQSSSTSRAPALANRSKTRTSSKSKI
ncbi:hypothetical protein EI94DRAFT_1054645 [Lactarius quietus]|nr:hypothetical protein EI94DRAFT_1054645 [Lactarius quietus]